MAWYKWVDCSECDGTCKIWTTLRGSGQRALSPCHNCIFGQVRVRMSDEEVKVVLQSELEALNAV